MTRYVNPVTRLGGVDQVVVADRGPAGLDDAPFDDTPYVRVNGEWLPANNYGGTFSTLSVSGESDLIPILAYVLTDDVATIFTVREHGFAVGESVFVAGTDPTFDGAHTVLETTSSSFTYSLVSPDMAYVLAAEGATVNPGTTLLVDPVLSGLTIYGTEFLDYIAEIPKGIVAKGLREVNSEVTTTTEQPYLQVDANLKAGRSYRFFTYMGLRNDTAGGRSIGRVRFTTDGSAPDITSTELRGIRADHSAANTTMPVPITKLIEPAVDVDYRFLSTFLADVGTVHVNASTASPSEMWIEDIGLQIDDTGIDHAGTPGVPPPPPPPTLKTYVKTFTSIGARSYMGNGNPDSSQGAEDMKQGYSSYDGDSRSLWIFPTFTGAVGADEIIRVRIRLHAVHWNYGSGGTALIKRHNYAALPGSDPVLTTVQSRAGWPRNTGLWVDITNAAGVKAAIIAGTFKGVGVGPAGTTNQLYYGRFRKTGVQVEITYKR